MSLLVTFNYLLLPVDLYNYYILETGSFFHRSLVSGYCGLRHGFKMLIYLQNFLARLSVCCSTDQNFGNSQQLINTIFTEKKSLIK